MACEDIARGLTALRNEVKGLEELIPNLQGAGLQAAQANLANKRAQIAVEQDRLAESSPRRGRGEPAAASPLHRPGQADPLRRCRRRSR